MEELFEFEGQEYTLAEVQKAAEAKSLNIDDYIKEYNISRKPGKTSPTTPGAVVEEIAAPELTLTESPSVDISLDLPEQPKTGTLAQTEFIPEPISKEREEEILLEYNKVSNIDIEKEAINKKQSKLKRFQQGEFKLDEKEEFDYWKSSNGKLFEESEILSEQEIEDRKQANQTVFLSKIPAYERQEIFAKNQKLLEEQINFVNKSTEKRNNLVLQYNNIENVGVKSQEDFIYKRNLINQIKFEDIERRRALSNLNRTADLVDDFKRSYAFYDIAEQSFKTIGTDIAIGAMSTIDMLKTEEGQKASYLNDLIDYREGLQQFAEENLAKPIRIESVNSLDKAFVWGTHALANQLPTLAMAFTGQAALPLFFATGYGSKMSDFELGERKAKKELPLLEKALETETNPEKRKEIQKNIDYHSRYLNVSDGIKALTSLAHGGAEAFWEGLTTLKLVGDLQNIGNNILKAGGSRKAIYNAFKAAPMSIGLESLGESATQITQNVADILIFGDDKSILENVPEAAAQGALFGSGFAIPNLGTAINAGIQSTISTRSDNAKIKKKLKEINDLTFELQSNGQLAPEDKKELQKNIQQKISEVVRTTDITRARFQRLSYEQQQEVFDLERQIGNSIERWKDIGASNMNESTKNSLREEIKNEIQTAQDKKQSLLESGDARLKDLETISTEKLLEGGDIEQSKRQYLRWRQGIETFIKKYNLPIEVSIENLTKEQYAQYGNVGGSYLNKKITIYENIAPFKNPSTPLHELTHAMLETFGLSKKNFDKLEESFKALLEFKKANGIITDKQYNNTIAKYELYQKDKKTKKDASEELLTSFVDAISENALDKKDVSFLTKIGQAIKDIITSKTSKIEAENFDLNTAEGVYNFLTQFTESVAQGKRLKKMIGVEIPEKVQKETKAFSKSISGDNIQKIFDEKGKDGAFDIIEAYKPLTTKLTNKYRDVPGFDFELLQSEIEIGKRGLLDLINAYDPSKGATLNTYIQGQLANRSIEAANRILDTEFKLDVTEAKGVTDTATAEETIEAAEQVEIANEIKSLRKQIGLPEELVNTVKNAVIKTFGTKLPNPQDPKFRLELQRRFRTELKKPIAKFVGKQADYESFLRDNFQSIYNKLPQSLINKRFKNFAEPVLDENGKQLRERTAEGNKVFTKKKISKAEFIKYFLGSEVGRSTQGTRKTAIVEAVAEEIAFDATMEVLNDPDVIQKYQDIAGITGEVLPENFKSLIAKQVDRAENFKFSKSLIDIAKTEYNLEQQELITILNEYTFDDLITEYPLLGDFIFNEYKITGDRSRESFLNAIDFAKEYFSNKIKENISDKNVYNVTKEILLTLGRSTRTAAAPLKDKKTKEIIKENILPPLLSTNQGFYDNVLVNIIPKEYLSEEKLHVKNNMVFWGSERLSNIVDITDRNVKEKTVQNPKKYRKKLDIQAEYNQNILIALVTNTKVNDRSSVMSLLKLLQMDQRSLVRSAIKTGIIIKNPKLNPIKKGKLARFKFEKLIWEHNSPANVIIEYIEDYFNGKRNLDEVIYKIKSSRVNLISKTIDEALNKNKKLKASEIEGENRYNVIESLLNNHRFDGNEIGNSYNLISPITIKLSKSLNKEFNTILEQSSGIKATKKFSPVEARIAGKGKGKFKLFIPYSADDFVGLLYTTLADDKTGDQQMNWYRENLLRPFSRGIQQYEAAKQNALREWQILKKEAKKSVPGGLDKKNASGLTNQEAVRLYIWKQQGMEIPGTKGSAAFVNENLKTVRKNPELKAFAESLIALNPEGYPAPTENWDSGDITTDLVSYIDGVKRSEFLTEFKDNAAKIFSDSNKEKLRALYGDNFIEALDDMLHRMKTGTNRRFGASKIEKQFMDWTNNSVGAIMFFNARSAVLQTLSAVNFINFSDNNPINAAIAFGNFPQYVKDFSTLFNSNFLKQRRTGLQTDVNADEIARAAKGAKNTARAMLSAILKFGFTPTQIADSFAIASGGATFYRNRIKKYKKEGLSQQEAETKAFTDFQEIAEETQQSARPDRISLQQASSLGRLILAFGNTPMQYARLTKKASLDLINGRGDWKTNISKIAYYSVIQNIIFSALQQGLFALLFDDEDDDKEKSRLFRIGNSSLDTFLRGSGVYGAAAATAKNMILKIIEESEKSRPDYTKVAIEATALSPPINSKLRKLVSAGKTFTYKQSKEKVFTEGFSLENPAFLAVGKVISAGTNLPADRVVQKADHIYTAMQPETELWQAIALSLGWSEWDLNMIEKQTKKQSIKKPVKIQTGLKKNKIKVGIK